MACGVADQRGEVADDEHHAVTEFLKLLHLPDQHGVAEMQIGRGRVESDLDDERPPVLEGMG